MNAVAVLERCRELGITLSLAPPNRLVAEYTGELPDDLRAEIRQHKPELLAILVQQALAGKRQCACGWYCYDWDLALPCKVARGEKTLAEYAQACYPDEPDRQQAISDLYSHAYAVWQAKAQGLGHAPQPAAACPHQTPSQVAHWWQVAQARDASVSVCACCGGPAPSGQLACRRCEHG